jgi:GNAT superfamily N-acetyltransferase
MEFTIQIAPLLPADVQEAYHLETEETEILGQLLWYTHTPYAHAVKGYLDGELLGYAYGHMNGTTGWVRNVYVNPCYFNEGLGTALVQALLRWMEEQGAEAQGVVAPAATHPFWKKLGFEPEVELMAYGEGTFINATRDEVVHMEPQHLLGVLHLDRRATGEDRSEMIRDNIYLGSVYVEGTRVRGFLLTLLGRALIVADSPLVGLELQRWLLPIQSEIVLPVGQEEAAKHLVEMRNVPRPVGTRLWRGPAPEFHPEMIYAWDQGWG